MVKWIDPSRRNLVVPVPSPALLVACAAGPPPPLRMSPPCAVCRFLSLLFRLVLRGCTPLLLDQHFTSACSLSPAVSTSFCYTVRDFYPGGSSAVLFHCLSPAIILFWLFVALLLHCLCSVCLLLLRGPQRAQLLCSSFTLVSLPLPLTEAADFFLRRTKTVGGWKFFCVAKALK